MEFMYESLALGVDLLILGVCLKEYYNYKKAVISLKKAPQVAIDSHLKYNVSEQKDQKIPYAFVRGTVKPIGAPIRSVMSPKVAGVIQVIKLREHRVARGVAGFWTEQRRLMHVSSNDVPFELRNGKHGVEIVDALSAAILDMDIVYDHYEPASLSLFDHVFGFFSGVRQKGLRTTEEVLREGAFITVVGELELDGKVLRMQPSSEGPMYITTATKSTLIKKFENAKSSMIVTIFFCGTISAVIMGLILRKLYFKIKRDREAKRVKDALDRARRERRSLQRVPDMSPSKLCVVCVRNPKEIILLPCGHVCLCEDCSEQILNNCPVCRTTIENRSAAFIS